MKLRLRSELRQNQNNRQNHHSELIWVWQQCFRWDLHWNQGYRKYRKNIYIQRSAIADFYKICQAFYIELTSDITKRFNFRDSLFSIISIVIRNEALEFKIKPIVSVLKRCPVLERIVTSQKLDEEWRAHATLDFSLHDLDGNDDAESYWGKVFRLQNRGGQYVCSQI